MAWLLDGLGHTVTILVTLVTLTVAVIDVSLDIYIPVSCDASGNVYQQTVDYTLNFIANSNYYPDVDITHNAFDSCQETSVLDTLVGRLSNDGLDNHVTIGPGSHSLCETTARLAHYHNKTIVSFTCTQKELSTFSNYGYFLRTVPPTSSTATALSKLLRYFLWKRVAIVTSTSDSCWTLTKDVYYGITSDEFVVENVIEIQDSFDDVTILRQLRTIKKNTKGILLCLDDTQISDVIQLIDQSNLDDGGHALFLIRTDRSSAVTEDGIISPPWPAGQNVTYSDSILRHLLIIYAHPYSTNTYESFKYNMTLQNIQTSEVDESLFNALSLTASAIQSFSSVTSQPLTSTSMYAHAQNLQFIGLYGNLTLTPEAELRQYFSVWDYRRDSNLFKVVMETDANVERWEKLRSIDWPRGGPPEEDYCDFYSCEVNDSGLSVGSVVAIVMSSLIMVAASIAAAWLIRRKLMLKEMERGPNKIILNEGDLVFVSPHSVSRSMRSVRSEKPDLLKIHQSSFLEEPSEFSMSHSSFPDSTFESGDTARYNGDTVYLKQILVKGFEMKAKVRNFLKSMRDMRNENVNPFIGCYSDPFRTSIVFEYCSRKSLEDIIANEAIKLDWDFKLSLLADLVKGMKYIHNSPLKVHGRLKSGNCVVDSRFVLKITDYGVINIYERYQTRRKFSAKELLWTAPELLRDLNLLYVGSQKGDVFSFAIIMQEVILRSHPYSMLELDACDIIKKVRKPPPLCRPSVSQQAAPPQYIHIMKQCWSEVPDMRPEFDDIHKQFKEITKGRKHNIVDSMFKKLEKYSSDLEAIVEERTAQFEEEKKKVVNLLSQMLPASVAKALISGEPVDPESFDEVSIYFSDIVGFTTISAMSTPIQVVELLNDLYTMFDSTIDDYDVYKVETIGDAYMVSSGLPLRNGNRHAGEISTMALDLLSKCGQFVIRHMPEVPMRLRIGLHTGPCVAGVVGLRMPRYCLFGDTVNTASRMESTGLPFRIHVSPFTKDVLDVLGGYKLRYRGETELKGKGMVKSYWLTGKEGFHKPLPEPPEMGGDNHGLASVLDKMKAGAKKLQRANSIHDNQKQDNKTHSNKNHNNNNGHLDTKPEATSCTDSKNLDPRKSRSDINKDTICNGDASHKRESVESLLTNNSDKSDLSTTPIKIEEKPRCTMGRKK